MEKADGRLQDTKGATPAIGKSRGKRGRRPGRPTNPAKVSISKELIVEAALRLCQREPLQDISIVRMAREFGVTPALVHYYIGARTILTSSVMNSWYCEIVSQLPKRAPDWRVDVAAVARTIYGVDGKYPGIVSYVMSNNRYRLIQDVEKGQTDYGILFFDRIVSSVRAAGLDAPRTAMFTHLLLQHVLASAFQRSCHQLPGDHRDFIISHLGRLGRRELPNAHFVMDSFSTLNSNQAFEAGLELLIQGIEHSR